jgi:hypothetical protein
MWEADEYAFISQGGEKIGIGGLEGAKQHVKKAINFLKYCQELTDEAFPEPEPDEDSFLGLIEDGLGTKTELREASGLRADQVTQMLARLEREGCIYREGKRYVTASKGARR